MKKTDIIIPVESYTYDELSDERRALAEEARQATFRAYCPYSHFHVGAAIRLDTGQIVTGSNQENAAFPSGTCAERTAAFYAHATWPEARFRAIAVAARGTDGEFTAEPTAPCGACRQVLLEYEVLAGEPVEVLLAAADKVYVLPSVRSILPLAFSEF